MPLPRRDIVGLIFTRVFETRIVKARFVPACRSFAPITCKVARTFRYMSRKQTNSTHSDQRNGILPSIRQVFLLHEVISTNLKPPKFSAPYFWKSWLIEETSSVLVKLVVYLNNFLH